MVYAIYGTETGDDEVYDGDYGNLLQLGGERPGGDPEDPVVTAEDMWNVDTKIDDGMPATGSVRVRERKVCTVQSDGSAQTSAGANAALFDSVYDIQNTDIRCGFMFPNVF